MSHRLLRHSLLGCLAFAASACADTTSDHDDPAVAIDIAALTLTGVGDAVWDIEVDNGATPTPQVVWQRRISSARFGDGAGSAAYVGPCDASLPNNTVKLWVVGLYSAPVSTLGSFASGAAGGVVGAPVPFQNPTTSGPLTRAVTCVANADTAVRFDVSLMRPADQGFFDIAVTFDNVFCSAKFDCCTENAAGTACASDLDLLFDASSARAPTMVLGFACTAGPGAAVDTNLYLDALTLDCSSPSASTFAPDFTIDPTKGPGNACAAGNVAACVAVKANGALVADDYLYQIAFYRGQEQATSGSAPANILYWNAALGVKHKVGAGRGIEDCWLRARATADNSSGSSLVDNGVIAAGDVYPFVQWDVNLASCAAEPLTFGDPSAPVHTTYTGTTGGPTTFKYGFGSTMPAAAFACGDGVKNGDEGCDDGNQASGDGCSTTCTVEANFACSGSAPSVCSCSLPSVFHWVSWSSISGSTATGTVGTIPVTLTSSAGLLSKTSIQHYSDVFGPGQIAASFGVPNANPTVGNRVVSSQTLTFQQAVPDPVLVFASIGDNNTAVTVTFDDPISVLFQSSYQSSFSSTEKSVVGREANAIVKVAGSHTQVKFQYLTAENSVDFAFGFVTPNAACPVVH